MRLLKTIKLTMENNYDGEKIRELFKYKILLYL